MEEPDREGIPMPCVEFVNEQDVSGAGQIDGTASCRVYATTKGIRGVPSVEEIAAALRAHPHSSATTHGNGHGRWQSSVAMLPAVGMSLLPKLAWPAYAAAPATLVTRMVTSRLLRPGRATEGASITRV